MKLRHSSAAATDKTVGAHSHPSHLILHLSLCAVILSDNNPSFVYVERVVVVVFAITLAMGLQ